MQLIKFTRYDTGTLKNSSVFDVYVCVVVFCSDTIFSSFLKIEGSLVLAAYLCSQSSKILSHKTSYVRTFELLNLGAP